MTNERSFTVLDPRGSGEAYSPLAVDQLGCVRAIAIRDINADGLADLVVARTRMATTRAVT